MFDITREPLLTLGQAAKLVPGPKPGRTISARTLWRWVNQGHRGVKLEAVRRPGGTCLTSAAAVGRFLAAIAHVKAPPRIEESNRPQQDAWADAYLDAHGVTLDA